MKNLLAVLLLAMLAFPVFATGPDSYTEESGNATSVCHTALPSFDNPIRFRPLAVANEGTSNAFVTCAFRAPRNSQGQKWFGLTLKNMSSQGFVQVTCTGVAGVDNGSGQYMPKTITLAPLGRMSISWTAAGDNDGDNWQTNTGVSCNLPPSVAINEATQGYYQK